MMSTAKTTESIVCPRCGCLLFAGVDDDACPVCTHNPDALASSLLETAKQAALSTSRLIELEAENARLRAVLSGLPKLGDGKPAIPGMKVWVVRWPDEDTPIGETTLVVRQKDFDAYGLDQVFAAEAAALAESKGGEYA